MGFLVDHQTYTRTYDDPEGGDEKLEVVLRVLDAGDKADLEDTIAMEFAESEGSDVAARAQLRMGTMKMLTVQRAIVSWSLPITPTAESVRRLHPKTLEEIFADVHIGEAPKEDPSDPLPGGGTPAASGDAASS